MTGVSASVGGITFGGYVPIAPYKLVGTVLKIIKEKEPNFRIRVKLLHQIFFQAKDEYFERLNNFDLLDQPGPFSPTIQNLIGQFQQAKILGAGEEELKIINVPDDVTEGLYPGEIKTAEEIAEKIIKASKSHL